MHTLDAYYRELGFDPSRCPDRVKAFPSMMHPDEKTLLYALARHHFRGEGVIVDAGLFLGASTHAFCTGIRDQPVPPALAHARPVQAYDIALWHSAGFDKYLDLPGVREWVGEVHYADGESYLPLLQRLLAPHLALIEFRIGDIVRQIRGDAPIEIAFFDCLKNHERDWAAYRALAPFYRAGHTVIVQQDYFFEDALDNKIRQEFLADHFRFLGAAATSAAFKLEKPLPPEYAVDDPVPRLAPAERVRLLRQAAARIPVSAFQLYAAMGVVAELIRQRAYDEAAAELGRIEAVIQATPLPARPAAVAASFRQVITDRLRG